MILDSRGRKVSPRNARRLARIKGDNRSEMGGTPLASPTPSDNNPGNQGNPGGNESGGGNNTGPAFDPEAFWNPAPAGGGAGADGKPAGSTPAPTPPPGQQVGEGIAASLAAMDVGNNFMTQEMAEKMAQGDYGSFNEGLKGYGQSVAKQTLTMMVPILKAMSEDILGKAGQKTQEEFGSREDSAALLSAIPSAAKPEIAAIVRPIFAQALKSAKDRPAAIEMTKMMLQHTTKQFQNDDSLGIAPKDPGNSAGPAINWLEELTGRS